MDARSDNTFVSLLPTSLVGSGSAKKADLASTATTREMGSNHLNYVSKLVRRFWEKVEIGNSDECWNWTASRKSYNYGQFYVRGYKMVAAHRVAWAIKNGSIPTGLWVLHKCNNPLCCNPGHLYLGTVSDNSQDSIKVGTHFGLKCKGENHPFSKLTKYDVWEIRRLYKTGKITQRALAKMFRVSQRQVWRIVNFLRWRHI